jgi:regulator of protease activity HflC (stomatin/prohibitin superfamily)
MKNFHISIIIGFLFIAFGIAGCGSSEEIVNKEASTSAIRAAQEVGATEVPSASLYLQLAKEGLAKAETLAKEGEKEEAESMLRRAQADAELAIILSRGDADKTEANQALERVKKLRLTNK